MKGAERAAHAGVGEFFAAEASRYRLPVPVFRRLVATHEAGHAVAAMALGVPVKRVELVSDDRQELGSFDFTPTSILTVASALVAGERAQDRWLRERGLWDERRARLGKKGARHDRALIARAVPDFAIPHEVLADAVETVLADRWDGVEAVAAALAERGCLDATDLYQLAGPGAIWVRDVGTWGGWIRDGVALSAAG